MLKDYVSKATATKKQLCLAKWFTLALFGSHWQWHETMIHTFWGGLSLRVSWVNHKTAFEEKTE